MILAAQMKQTISKVLTSAFSTVNAKEKEFAHRLAGAEEKTFVGIIRQRSVQSLKNKVQFVSLMMSVRGRDFVMIMIVFVKGILIADSKFYINIYIYISE